jgi:hypothetical protein
MIEELLSLKSDLPSGTVRKSIPEGMAGTEATLDEMRKCVDQGKRDPRIRELAGKIISGEDEKDYEGYARAIHNWIRSNIKYAFDPAGVETLEWPARILDIKIADCDSSAILNAALNESIGLESRFRAIKANRNNQNEFSHIWSEVYIPQKGWMASDCTMPKGFGWRPPDHYGAKNWPASHDRYENHDGDHMASLQGLSAVSMGAEEVISGIYYGTLKSQLVQWGADLDRQTQEVNNLSTAANSMTDLVKQAQAKALVAQARESIYQARLQFVQARNYYDQIAGELNRIPGVHVDTIQSGFNGLAGLSDLGSQFGVLPAAVVAGAVDIAIILSIAAAAALAIGAVSDAIRGNDSILTQIRKIIESAGVVIKEATDSVTWLAVVAGLGLAGYVGYLFLKKKGKI